MWLLLGILLFAGCVAPAPAEREPVHLLLGARPCHEGICWVGISRGLADDGLRPIVSLESPPTEFSATPHLIYWVDEAHRLWGLDVLRREVDEIARWEMPVHVSLEATEGGVWFTVAQGKQGHPVGPSDVWFWDWESRTAESRALGAVGAIDLLDERDGELLVALMEMDGSGKHLPSIAVVGPGATADFLMSSEGQNGTAAAGFGDELIGFAFDNGDGGRIWMARHGATVPIWSPPESLRNLLVNGKFMGVTLAGESGNSARIIDPIGAAILHSRAGTLHGLRNQTGYVATGGFDPQVQFVPGLDVRAGLLGLQINDSQQTEDRVYFATSGRFGGIIEMTLER